MLFDLHAIKAKFAEYKDNTGGGDTVINVYVHCTLYTVHCTTYSGVVPTSYTTVPLHLHLKCR